MDKQAKQIFWYLVGLVALVVWILNSSGCGGCVSCGVTSQSPSDCETTCGAQIWYSDAGSNCHRAQMAESAMLSCYDSFIPDVSSTAKICTAMRKTSIIVLGEEGLGKTWINGDRLAIEIKRGNDWRVNSYVHESGHFVQQILTGDSDPNHLRFAWGDGGVYPSMKCLGDAITSTWNQ